MDGEIALELATLKVATGKQNELQEEANGVMRGACLSNAGVAQETLELRQHLEKRDAL
jgi:hypothetical protein